MKFSTPKKEKKEDQTCTSFLPKKQIVKKETNFVRKKITNTDLNGNEITHSLPFGYHYR
jgi:hypothetical protein